jgi:SAM-dependent methyltransferase
MDHLLRATALAEQRHFWFRGLRAFVEPLVTSALADVAHPRILDCGCGTGANMDWLRRYGDVWGFDLSPTGLELGRLARRTRLARADAAAVPFADGTFDLVTSFDVLYSLPSSVERAAVGEMRRVVRPGGAVLINVAAMQALRGNHSMLSREQRRYSRADLEALLASAGLQVARITYTNATLVPPLAALRTVQRWRGLAAEDDVEARREITVPAAPVNALLTAVLAIEARWIRRFDLPFGSSLLCLARRPVEPATAAARR